MSDCPGYGEDQTCEGVGGESAEWEVEKFWIETIGEIVSEEAAGRGEEKGEEIIWSTGGMSVGERWEEGEEK